MTREEAKKYYLLKNKWDTINREELYDLIDEIYDDFESRVCKNCKHYEGDDVGGFCLSMQNTLMNGDSNIEVNANFSCNRFERKNNETNL